jgi:hypothetical protein
MRNHTLVVPQKCGTARYRNRKFVELKNRKNAEPSY